MYRARIPLLSLPLLVGALALSACRKGEKDPSPDAAPKASPDAPKADTPEAVGAPGQADELPHTIVFSDRTSHAYLLLLPDRDKPRAPDRASLAALVEKKLPAGDDRDALQKLIATRPHATPLGAPSEQNEEASERSDLLGLHVELLPVGIGEEALVPPNALRDPVLLRALDEKERSSLATRQWALLIRADYRHQLELRGFRLLERLVELVASERGALIHDPDTWETFGRDAFSKRRLRANFRNIAEQIAIVPSLDPSGGETSVRLSTRGMRRFASVDLELDGLPADPQLLQRASLFLQGLAYQMSQLGELDPRGYAIELEPELTLHIDDVRATLSDPDLLPPCENCPGQIPLHLVERKAEKGDPLDHVVARVVAPRAQSDRDDYDHPAWALKAIGTVFGAPPPAPSPGKP